jgi:ABC-2 type transport system permease protein
MSQPSPERAAGNIYDLGYRSYTGPRLGRFHAVQALYLQSLRATFGLGRRTGAKIIPIALVIMAALPAVVQLGVAAASSSVIDIFKPEEYYDHVGAVLALFAAAVAPELVGRDQRNKTLSLYFSRPLRRTDYALAKLGALATAMLFLTLLPQLLMFLGNAFAGNQANDYFRDNADQLLPIVASSVVLSVFTAAVALAIAAQTSRRAYSTGGVIAAFVLTSTIASILFNTMDNDVGRYVYPFGLYWLMRGVAFWIFRASPGPEDELALVDLPGAYYFLVITAITLAATYLLVRRYGRIST